ncbi:MAG: hypothetical protein ACLUFU_00980 [Bacilli bacterium]
MAGLINSIRKIFLNRNTVTILAVIAGVIVLWFFYNMTLSNAINPVRVPVATREILATELITADDIEYVEVNKSFLNNANNILTNSAQIINYYVNNGTSISKGAMFYKDQVTTREEISKTDFDNIPDGYTIYWLNVDNKSTYANSIYPGDKIDLWITGSDPQTKTIIYDEFINSIDVLEVKDSDGLNVFDDAENRTPAWLSFAVTDEMNTYLRVLDRSNFEIIPVPRNKMYTVEGKEVSYSNDNLTKLVESLYQPVY